MTGCIIAFGAIFYLGHVQDQLVLSIYASASLWLMSYPVYRTCVELAPDHWVQLVFEVRVRAGSFKIHLSTLSSSKYWDGGVWMDAKSLDDQALEWVVPES